ncbi:hypothetical protein [Herbidospora cretacea]|nr:hypothetical protein [Herbidospora cretacea]
MCQACQQQMAGSDPVVHQIVLDELDAPPNTPNPLAAVRADARG